jgi:hypothetical protein
MTIKRAVLLGYSLHDYKSELKQGDLVSINDGFEQIYLLDKIDPRYGKRKDEPDTDFRYLVKGQYNMTQHVAYERSEISKAHLAFFDFHKYYKEGKKIFLGGISAEDLMYIKAKYANDMELGFSEFNQIQMNDLVGLDFHGSTYNKELYYDHQPGTGVTVIQYFKIDKPE